MPTVEERARYRSDFGVSWPRLPIFAAVALLAALALAWCLKFALVQGWYLVILLPMVVGSMLAGLLYVLVGWSRCRNSWLAAAVGLVAALIAYLGYYHLCLLDHLPPGNAWRIDLLPKYIAFRMETDVAEDVGRPQGNAQAKKPASLLNYWAFAWELLTIVGFAAGVSWTRARRAYCVELDQWMQRDAALLARFASNSFRGALDNDTLPQFVAQTSRGGDVQTASRLLLEYAIPQNGSPLEFPIYATFEDFPSPNPWYRPRQMRKTFVRQVELELAEVMTLRPLFPKLAQLLETKHAELRDVPADVPASPSPPLTASDQAEITPVPEPYRKLVQGKGYALRVNLIGAIPLIVLLGGMGVIAAGIWLLKFVSLPLGLVALVAGAAGVLWGIYSSQFCLSVPENRWIRRRLTQEVGQRGDTLVDPLDPEAIFVSLIPRESFTKIQWTMASDVLFLKIDPKRRQLLLEGDADRYRIPAGAISACEPQCFFHPMDAQHTRQLWMVHLMIRVPQGWQELLLSINSTSFKPLTNARRRQTAEDVCRQIAELGGREESYGVPH